MFWPFIRLQGSRGPLPKHTKSCRIIHVCKYNIHCSLTWAMYLKEEKYSFLSHTTNQRITLLTHSNCFVLPVNNKHCEGEAFYRACSLAYIFYRTYQSYIVCTCIPPTPTHNRNPRQTDRVKGWALYGREKTTKRTYFIFHYEWTTWLMLHKMWFGFTALALWYYTTSKGSKVVSKVYMLQDYTIQLVATDC